MEADRRGSWLGDVIQFHLGSKADHHTLRVCSSKNPHPVAEQEEDSQQVYVFYDISYYKIYGTGFLRRKRKSVSLLLGHGI